MVEHTPANKNAAYLTDVDEYSHEKEKCMGSGHCIIPPMRSVSGIARCTRNQSTYCSIETCPFTQKEKDNPPFLCSTCARLGCSIWYNYVLTKIPPKTDIEIQDGNERYEKFKAILKHTGCKHYIKKE